MENTVETKVGPTVVDESPKYSARNRGGRRALSLIDFVLRFIAVGGTLGSAVSMGTTDQTQTFFTQFAQVRAVANYDDLPTFRFFVIANSIACGYLLLSLPMSIFHVVKPAARNSRIALLIFDMVILALVTAGASSATAIVYLAHKGNSSANWIAICQQFDSFCTRISGSLIGSFGAVIVFMLLIVTTALAVSRG